VNFARGANPPREQWKPPAQRTAAETDAAFTRFAMYVDYIRRIPGVIVQGRYDVVCPARSAWDLHRAWPEARFILVPDAGHSISEPGTRSALIRETARFAKLR
jgi:pimeloyl-ACP methyl ester carboxylesterase